MENPYPDSVSHRGPFSFSILGGVVVGGLIVLLMVSVSPAEAEEVITFTHENDLFAWQDRYYSSGVKVNWFSGANDIPHLFDQLSQAIHVHEPDAERRMVYSLGQNMFTPRDITDPNPAEGDRPYAGWLYTAAGLIQDRGDRLDAYELQIGIVGPSARAGETQRWVHDNLWGDEPEGWDHQLRDELGVRFTYGRENIVWTTPVTHSTELEFTPGWALSVGNIHTGAQVSGGIRWGDYSDGDYGPPMIRSYIPGAGFYEPNQSFEWYLFTQLIGRAVAYEIFLDGNLLHDSPEVDRIPWQGEAQVGVVTSWETFRLSYTHVFPTRDFEEQDNIHHYGSVSLTVRF